MKTITLLTITAKAISTVTTAINMVMRKAQDNPEVDYKSVNLKGDDYLIMSESMTTVRELLKEFPAQLVSEELDRKRGDFYIHLFSKNDLTDLSSVHTACHDMHSEIYTILNDARDAIELYCK